MHTSGNDGVDIDCLRSTPPTPVFNYPTHDTPTLPDDWEAGEEVLQLAKEKLASAQRKTTFGRDYRGEFSLIVSCNVRSSEDWISAIRLTPDEISVIEQQIKAGLRPLNLRIRSMKLSFDGHGQREQTWELTVEVC